MSKPGAFYLRETISTNCYVFPGGMYMRGEPEDSKGFTYRIWPPGQECAFVVGVPRRLLRPVKRYKRRMP